MTTRTTTSLIIVIAILVAGCRTVTAPDTRTGSVRVDVALMDSTGNLIPRPYQGITVGIENTAFHALADSVGEAYFTNVPAGQYNIVASKPGFALMKYCSLLVEGPVTSYVSIGLAPVSSYPVVLDSVSGSIGGIGLFST